ncbi:MAG: hypothetical protein JRJ34_06545, partial [Deltaproteobacteria bacterium]|nr:hypothetical protein [Deltaproteobacteria bacterium]
MRRSGAHQQALNTLFPLKRVMAYDVNTEAVRGYADEIGSRLNLEVIPVGTPREAVTGCDIVVTAGPILKTPHATIQTGWLDEGAFASLVDFDSYWHPDAMQAAAKFCTDDTPQLRQYQHSYWHPDAMQAAAKFCTDDTPQLRQYQQM